MTGDSVQTTVRVAGLCAFAMIATQIAGKAVRDALFLSEFGIEALPVMVITADSSSFVILKYLLSKQRDPVSINSCVSNCSGILLPVVSIPTIAV